MGTPQHASGGSEARSRSRPEGLLSLLHRRAPPGPAADPRRPRWGKKRVEVARDAAGGLTEDRQAGGAAPDRNERLYEQVFSPARGRCRCVGDGTSLAQDRAPAADGAGSGSPPRSERRE
jgi:hypothetical protein